MAWAALQLVWVTMLLVVQTVQIARAVTTYENMKGAHLDHGSSASVAITSALATGSTLAGAQLVSGGSGLDPSDMSSESHGHHHHHTGCFNQWKKLLGIDTFVETALHGYNGKKTSPRKKRNIFSRGCMRNCKDFWCDIAPIFGKRPSGMAFLDGEVINYTELYEPPLRPMSRQPPTGDQAESRYVLVGSDEFA
jgi:hypothetical protein